MSFSEQIVYAMFKPSKYKEMLELKKSRFVVFVIVLMLALGIVRVAVPTAAVITGFGGFENLFINKISPMEYKDDKLSIEEKFEMSVGTYKVIIDTEDSRFPDEKMRRKGGYLAFGSEYMTLAYNVGGRVTRYQEIKLDSFLSEGFNNESLQKMIPFIYSYIVFMFIASCGVYFVKYALLSLIFGFFVNSINKKAGIGLSFGEVFKLCFYGQTLGIIISNFNMALGFLPVMLVSGVCVVLSVNMILSGIVAIGKTKQP